MSRHPLSRPYQTSSSLFLNFPAAPAAFYAPLLFILVVHTYCVTASEPQQKCTMSDKAQATVTLYTTALTTIVSTFTNPFVESFIMAWIAFLPLVRGAAGVIIYAVDALDHISVYSRIIFSRNPEARHGRGMVYAYHPTQPQAAVGILVHMIWWVWHVYMPYTQWTWFAEHYLIANSRIFFARGTAVGLLLVAMSVDYKARAIRAIGSKRFAGPFVALAMSILSVVVRVSLLGLMLTELIFAAIKNPNTNGLKNTIFIPIYIILSFVWGIMSFGFLEGRDHDVNKEDHPSMRLVVAPFAGAFFACFTCALAFVIFHFADAHNGLGIVAFVKCDSASVWERIQHVVF